MVELGAGSADKTRLLLSAAVERQDTVFYEPVDVSASALVEAQMRIEEEIPGVLVCPRVRITRTIWNLDRRCPANAGWCSTSDRASAISSRANPLLLLERVRAALDPGDCLLLGVDLVKDEPCSRRPTTTRPE